MTRSFVLALAAAVLVFRPATAAPDPTMSFPPADRISELYPSFARQFRLSGDVTLHCHAAERVKLACTVTGETPPDLGFREAALEVVAETRIAGEAPPGWETTLPIRFRPEPFPDTGSLTEPSTDSTEVIEAMIHLMHGDARLTNNGRMAASFASLDPKIRPAAEAAYDQSREAQIHAVARSVARRLDPLIAPSDARRLNLFLHSAEGEQFAHALAPGGDAGVQLLRNGWIEQADHRDLLEIMSRVGSVLNIDGIEKATMNEADAEFDPQFKALLCARVACHPIDQVTGAMARKDRAPASGACSPQCTER